mgnify:FL=1
MKTCASCGQTKPLSEFHWDGTQSGGYCSYCKQCKNQRTKAYTERRKLRPVASTNTGTKSCPRCQTEKSLNEFGRRISTSDGLCWCCKDCYNTLARQRRMATDGESEPVPRSRRPVNTSEYHQRRKGDPEYRARRAKRNSESRTRRRARRNNGKCIPYRDNQVREKVAYWGGRCWICRCAPDDTLHMDHVKPISKGGMDCLANLRPACANCNSKKNDRWPYLPPRHAAA